MISKLISINPSNYALIGEIQASTEREILDKVKLAKEASSEWSGLPISSRKKYLEKVLDTLQKRKDEFAQLVTQEMGMPIWQSKNDITYATHYLKWYLENAEKYLSPEVIFENDEEIHKVFHEPYGTAAVIVPWNYPASNFIWSVSQLLLAGNTVVFKISEEVPFCGKLIEEIMEGAEFPQGVFNEVYGAGEVGEFLARQPEIDFINFTGSTRTGKKILNVAATGIKKVTLELGGSAPGIIFEDANLKTALNHVYLSRFSNCGQTCDALKRLIVHESRVNEVIYGLKSIIEKVKLGDPEDPETQIGPLVSKKQLNLLESQVKDAVSRGAEIKSGGKNREELGGAFYEPTILTTKDSGARIWQEEVFGPVLPIMTFQTEEEAITLANDTIYGLGGYIYSENRERAESVALLLQTGMVSINGASYTMPQNPFGGYKQSGLGREHGKFGFSEVTQIKVVTIKK